MGTWAPSGNWPLTYKETSQVVVDASSRDDACKFAFFTRTWCVRTGAAARQNYQVQHEHESWFWDGWAQNRGRGHTSAKRKANARPWRLRWQFHGIWVLG